MLRRSPHDREILRLAVPALGALAAEPLYILVDTAIVGHLGTPELAALAIAAGVLTSAFTLFNFLTYGTTAQVARLHGAGHRDAAAGLGAQAERLALAVGALLLAAAIPLTGVPVEHPLVAFLAVLLGLVLFSALGTVVGIFAETFDHHTFVNNIVILPLTFLGGVFYSVDRLPSPWEEVSHVNPLFYLVSAVRHGFLGTSDVPIALALGVSAAMAAVSVAWSARMFRTGRRLKP